jgi:hypothetical protein
LLREIIVVSVPTTEQATDRTLDDGTKPIVHRRGGIGIAGADGREQLAVVEARRGKASA